MIVMSVRFVVLDAGCIAFYRIFEHYIDVLTITFMTPIRALMTRFAVIAGIESSFGVLQTP